MNQQQIKYLKERADSIFSSKCNEIKSIYAPTQNTLTWDEKISQINSGKAKLRPEIRYYTEVQNAFVYEGESKRKELKTKSEKRIASEIQQLTIIKTKLIDELMLGDVAVALQKLEAFEAIKVD